MAPLLASPSHRLPWPGEVGYTGRKRVSVVICFLHKGCITLCSSC